MTQNREDVIVLSVKESVEIALKIEAEVKKQRKQQCEESWTMTR